MNAEAQTASLYGCGKVNHDELLCEQYHRLISSNDGVLQITLSHYIYLLIFLHLHGIGNKKQIDIRWTKINKN